eukprot:TRINITY_DN2767_c0_g1_i1.p1 TRINITY_DN2767_c0_g1~~TRINITY_DN2767_c0_g1_i1.p1  ORF type:complete len:149 (+),score=47.59 TRINITY_DN2767_c0_g1_i1:74-520(+)
MSSLTKEQIQEFKDSFDLFDKDKDGVISISELETVLRALGQSPTQEEFAQLVAQIDKDGDGRIQFEEFLDLMEMKMNMTRDEDAECFGMFDKDKDGYIESAELRQVFDSLGDRLSVEEIDAMIKYADKSGNGKVSFDDFTTLISQLGI